MLKHTLFLGAATAALLTLSGAHAQAPPVGAPAAPA
ncbi:MAG: hypothetical protein JWQ01_777, partial [Massilia sp.]|nr:hypothetical protein [Massilia sp.]